MCAARVIRVERGHIRCAFPRRRTVVVVRAAPLKIPLQDHEWDMLFGLVGFNNPAARAREDDCEMAALAAPTLIACVSTLKDALDGHFGEEMSEEPSALLAALRARWQGEPFGGELEVDVPLNSAERRVLDDCCASLDCSAIEAARLAIERDFAICVEIGELEPLQEDRAPIATTPATPPPTTVASSTRPPVERRTSGDRTPARDDGRRGRDASTAAGIMPLARMAAPGALSYKDIGRIEELDLIAIAQSGDRVAMQTLCIAHDPFVIATARRHSCRADPNDLVQIARIGFMRAVIKFDKSRECRLTTYACWWIRQAINRYVDDNERDIRVPVHATQLVRMAKRLGATTPEMATEQTGTESAAMAWSLIQPAVRLDAPIGDDGDSTLGDLQPSPIGGPEEATLDAIAHAERARLIKEAFQILTPKEAEVLRRRFLCDDPETLAEVGASMGLSRERIRQIELKAFGKIQRLLFRRTTAEERAELLSG